MIALRPFSRKVGSVMIPVREGREIPIAILSSYSEKEIQELKDKKIIGDSHKEQTEPKTNSYNNKQDKK